MKGYQYQNKYRIYVPLGAEAGHDLECIAIDPDCILFKDKTYPECACGDKYLEKLGCLWCNRESNKITKST